MVVCSDSCVALAFPLVSVVSDTLSTAALVPIVPGRTSVVSVPQVTARTEEVVCCRLQQRNMATTVERLQLCLPGRRALRRNQAP